LKSFVLFFVILLSVAVSFAETPYPFPVPLDFKAAPYKFVCSDTSFSYRMESYYNPAATWVVYLEVENEKEIMVLVARKDTDSKDIDKRYFKLFHITDSGWKDRMSMSKDEEEVWYKNHPMKSAGDMQWRKECFAKQKKFEYDNDLSPAY